MSEHVDAPEGLERFQFWPARYNTPTLGRVQEMIPNQEGMWMRVYDLPEFIERARSQERERVREALREGIEEIAWGLTEDAGRASAPDHICSQPGEPGWLRGRDDTVQHIRDDLPHTIDAILEALEAEDD